MKLDDDPIHISIDEALTAVRANAWTEPDDEDEPDPNFVARTRIHTTAGGGGLSIGADWDLDQAESFIQRSSDRAWRGDWLGHELAVLADDRVIAFDCKRPA